MVRGPYTRSHKIFVFSSVNLKTTGTDNLRTRTGSCDYTNYGCQHVELSFYLKANLLPKAPNVMGYSRWLAACPAQRWRRCSSGGSLQCCASWQDGRWRWPGQGYSKSQSHRTSGSYAQTHIRTHEWTHKLIEYSSFKTQWWHFSLWRWNTGRCTELM